MKQPPTCFPTFSFIYKVFLFSSVFLSLKSLGPNAIPVVLQNGMNVDELTQRAANESEKKLVVVSEPLYQILAKSSKLSQELSLLDQQNKKVVSNRLESIVFNS